MVKEDVTTELQMELVELRHCQYDTENIKEAVTFRAQLSSTADADGTTLFSLIEGWVSTGPTIRVSGVLRTVDKDCLVAISDFSEEECVNLTLLNLPVLNMTALQHCGRKFCFDYCDNCNIAVMVVTNCHRKFNINKAEE